MNFLIEKNYEDIAYSSEQMVELLETHKVVVLRNYKLEQDPLAFFTKFSDNLGYIHNIDEDVLTGKSTGKRWIDITYDPAITNKYRTAPVAQPLHTDASYLDIRDNIQFFYCVSQAELGGATVFLDSRFLVELIAYAKETELLDLLQETEIVFSKQKRRRVSPILRQADGDYRLNWNYYCGDKNNSSTIKALFERFHHFLESRVVKSGLVTEVLLQKNDVVFFHDELVLHGRNAYFAKEKGQRSLNKGTLLLESRFFKNNHLHLLQTTI